ncbi:MAG: thioredoxin domain-containing protein [Ghiorsea sp.]
MKKNYAVALAILLMLAGFAAASYTYHNQQKVTQTARIAQHNHALEKFHSPRAGDPNAKVTIVEFMDPACETCSQFHPLVQSLMKEHKGKIKLVIRYAPFHQGSDVAVKILEAARKQGTYWGVMELMYESQSGWASHHNPQPEILWKYLEHYKFDVPALKKAMHDPAIDKIIAIDLADAKLLGANKTPTFFVNGKPLPSFGFQQLQTLVEEEIAATY